MISDFVYMPNIVACQYLEREFALQIDEFIAQWVLGDPKLLTAHRAAKQAASSELVAYEEWLCQQEPVDPASWMFDEDVSY